MSAKFKSAAASSPPQAAVAPSQPGAARPQFSGIKTCIAFPQGQFVSKFVNLIEFKLKMIIFK